MTTFGDNYDCTDSCLDNMGLATTATNQGGYIISLEAYGSTYPGWAIADYYFNGKPFNDYKEYLKAFNVWKSQSTILELSEKPIAPIAPLRTKCPKTVAFCAHLYRSAPSRSQIAKQKRKRRLHSER